MNDAGAISRALAARALDLVRELLPAGVREGAEWRCGSIAGEPGRSLAVHLFGPRAGVWADFAGGQAGDALDLVAAVKFRGDKGETIKWARQWLGLAPGSYSKPDAAPVDHHERPRHDHEAVRRQNAAKHVFAAAQSALAGTPADWYLKARGIDLEQLGRQPRALRFAPQCYNSESQLEWPALVAALTNAAGELTGVHRIWLAQDRAGAWGKAPLQTQKSSLGRVAGSAIRLWRGASKKPLKEAPPGDVLVLSEGLETGLSVALAAPEYRVMAVTGLSNFKNIELPPAITTVIIAGDNDRPGGQAEAALYAAAAALQRPGRTVKIARSPVGSDFNDCLTV